MTLDGKAAFANSRRSNASWKSARQKLKRLFVIPDSEPKFSISRTDCVMTLGSCFARNVEQYLANLGCDVPASRFSVPADEWHAERPTNILNIFTPPVFRQSMEWTAGIFQRDGAVHQADCEQFAFRLPGDQVIDLGLASARPVTMARFFQRRQQVYDLFVRAFDADCFIITPGLIESWLDHETGLYTNITPMRSGKLLDEQRFSFEVLSYQKCFDALTTTIDIVRKHNSRIKTLITVSPVPLSHTFSGKGILLANSYSKAVLRAVCETIASSSDAIDYFPSYEAVNFSRFGVWQRDRRHVRDRFVVKIVRTIGERYMRQ